MANWISFRFAPGRPLRQPISRTLLVSEAVNSRYPSPEMICCCETAPASAHPSQPEAVPGPPGGGVAVVGGGVPGSWGGEGWVGTAAVVRVGKVKWADWV